MAKALRQKKVAPEVSNEVTPETTEVSESVVEDINDNEMVSESEIPTVQEHKAEVKEEKAEEKDMEQSITEYLDKKGEGEHSLNEFIRSLFPIAKFNEVDVSLHQTSSRYIRSVLEKMRKDGTINIVGNTHMNLGEHYYSPETGVAMKKNLSTVRIIAKK